MKKILLFIFIAFKSLAQDAEYIKTQDTLYLLLEETAQLKVQKFTKFTLQSSSSTSLNFYEFSEAPSKQLTIWTQEDGKFPDKKLNRIVKRKDFLKTNKSKIIDADFIDTIGVTDFLFTILKLNETKRVIYVLNKRDLKKRKILLKKAKFSIVGYAEM
ncbi:hypothetical protein FMM05_04635 [Flavobacterium zepuense]|uniref:Uncharacterized protein n=1 Tax=Flavobacterium zepuense TaxID=2593302 RepID=A0A552V8B0_9FLAO|nr:hypothetical protein [Flavobacterium zepuense]TRW26669.1 hypothetical protein FMM05_04635 [Flavobacterium zepuense]